MGHRAIYMVKEAGQRQFRYSHWSAKEIPGEVAWGPETFMCYFHLVEQEHPSGSLLDEVFGEGGAAVDLDTRQLRVFGGEWLALHACLARAFIEFAQDRWFGWDVQWAHQGMTDLAPLLGIDPKEVQCPFEKTNPTEEFLSESLFVPGKWFLATVLDPLEEPRNYVIGNFLDALYEFVLVGPTAIDRLQSVPQTELPREINLLQGAVIDTGRRHLEYWFSEPEREDAVGFRAKWPGWSVARQMEGYPRHLIMSGQTREELFLSSDEIYEHLAPEIGIDIDGPEEEYRELAVRTAKKTTSQLSAMQRRRLFDHWIQSR